MSSSKCWPFFLGLYIDGLVQERRNSIANALELCLSLALTIWYINLGMLVWVGCEWVDVGSEGFCLGCTWGLTVLDISVLPCIPCPSCHIYQWIIKMYFHVMFCVFYTTRYIDSTPMSEVTLVTILYIHPPNHGHKKVVLIGMNDQLTSLTFYVNKPSHSLIRVF